MAKYYCLCSPWPALASDGLPGRRLGLIGCCPTAQVALDFAFPVLVLDMTAPNTVSRTQRGVVDRTALEQHQNHCVCAVAFEGQNHGTSCFHREDRARHTLLNGLNPGSNMYTRQRWDVCRACKWAGACVACVKRRLWRRAQTYRWRSGKFMDVVQMSEGGWKDSVFSAHLEDIIYFCVAVVQGNPL